MPPPLIDGSWGIMFLGHPSVGASVHPRQHLGVGVSSSLLLC